jgi:hypothetical protein
VNPDLREFFERLRGSDPKQVERLLEQLDPALRRIIRMRLVDSRLRHAVDTADILQSLLKDFLAQQSPEADQGGPNGLNNSAKDAAPKKGGIYAYLAAAARYKIHTRFRKERRHGGRLNETHERPNFERSVPQCAEDRDFIEAVRLRLREETRELLDLAAQGVSWKAIAEKMGGTPDALRMRLRREVATVLTELKLDSQREEDGPC